jgi:aryl-alcohol dehydrogenase-like predicted oxidoreductase
MRSGVHSFDTGVHYGEAGSEERCGEAEDERHGVI